MPRGARPRAGHPHLLAGAQRRLLGPLSAGTDDGPRGAAAWPRFSTKPVIPGEFCTTKHHASLSTKHHASGLFFFDQTPCLRTSSKQVATYKYRLRPRLLEISQDQKKSPNSLRSRPGQRLRRPPLRSGPPGDSARPLRLKQHLGRKVPSGPSRRPRMPPGCRSRPCGGGVDTLAGLTARAERQAEGERPERSGRPRESGPSGAAGRGKAARAERQAEGRAARAERQAEGERPERSGRPRESGPSWRGPGCVTDTACAVMTCPLSGPRRARTETAAARSR